MTEGLEGIASDTGYAALSNSVADEVSRVIVDCIVEFAEVAREEVQRDSFLDALDIDSLDLVEIAQVIEERFKIVIEQSHMKDVKTVGDAIDAVLTLLPE